MRINGKQMGEINWNGMGYVVCTPARTVGETLLIPRNRIVAISRRLISKICENEEK